MAVAGRIEERCRTILKAARLVIAGYTKCGIKELRHSPEPFIVVSITSEISAIAVSVRDQWGTVVPGVTA